jgi:hypothetical protein
LGYGGIEGKWANGGDLMADGGWWWCREAGGGVSVLVGRMGGGGFWILGRLGEGGLGRREEVYGGGGDNGEKGKNSDLKIGLVRVQLECV